MKSTILKDRKKLNKENRKLVSKMTMYFTSKSLNHVAREEIVEEIIGMCLEHQQRGEAANDVFGDDYKVFCDNLSENAVKTSLGEKILYWMVQISIFISLSLGLAFVLALCNWGGFFMKDTLIYIPLLHISNYLLYGVLGIFGITFLYKNSFNSNKKVLSIYFIGFILGGFIYSFFFLPIILGQPLGMISPDILYNKQIYFFLYPCLLLAIALAVLSNIFYKRLTLHNLHKIS